MTYTVTNPVKAGLVTRCDRWPGLNILPAQIGRKMKVRRPKLVFRPDGDMPEEVEVEFVVPSMMRRRLAAMTTR